MSSPSITIIVAATLTNGIGKNASLPWRLPKEMKYFQSVTTNTPEQHVNAVIMGRNTWESIPERFRPLPNRLNLIVTKNEQYLDKFRAEDQRKPKPTVHNSIKDAISHAVTASQGLTNVPNNHRLFIIGGAAMYREALGLTTAPPNSDTTSTSTVSPPAHRHSNILADRILLTRILSPAFEDCDVHMPEFRNMKKEDGEDVWKKATHEELVRWVGQEVPESVLEENKMKPGEEVKYGFEMWVREV